MARSERNQSEDVEAIERDIRSIHHLLIKLTKPSFAKLNLSPPRFQILLAIQRHGPLNMAELNLHTYVTGSTLTTLVDGLEGDRLVERYRISEDRRKVFVRATESGARLIAEIRGERQDHLSRAMSGVSKDAKSHLADHLRIIRERLEADALEQGDRTCEH